MRSPRSSQSGNAVVFILIAIALFAALSYTFIRSGQQGQGNINAHQARMGAQELISFGQKIERAVDKLRQRGCSETEIDFSNAVWNGHAPGSNPNARADGSCSLFTSNGANLTPGTPDASYYNYYGAVTGTPKGSITIRYGVFPGVGTSEPDIVIYSPYPSNEVCMAVNELAGVKNRDATSPPHNTGSTGAVWAGAFSSNTTMIDTDGLLTGKPVFCTYSQGGTPVRRFIYTILAR